MALYSFDINDTITAFDSTDTSDLDARVNEIISRSTEYKGYYSYYEYIKNKYPKDYKSICSKCTEEYQDLEHLRDKYWKIREQIQCVLFPSFLKFLDRVDKVILRTFGSDGNLVIQEIQKYSSKFNNFIVGKMGHNGNEEYLEIEGKIIKDIENITEYLYNTENSVLIQEDYRYWNSHKRRKEAGKLLYPSNFDQLFFDDNECVDIIKNDDSKSITKYIRVNTAQAILDDDYYINFLI